MSPIGPEHFQRLEEFSPFVSCIKCFGRSIIPPLLTPSRRHELKLLGIAAKKKEEDILKKKEDLKRKKQDIHVFPEIHSDDFRPNLQSNTQESCALRYPSAKDCQEGISVAISKFPTSGIYSSVHTDAIVCSNVVESNSTYAEDVLRNSLLVPELNFENCIQCSHNNMDLECSLCQAESNHDFSKSFTSEVSPEVPCRTYSLLQQNVGIENDESNCAVETDCESLPTVIFNQKCIPIDTDTESIATYVTQSTDLEKYMEFSCEFSSPDYLALATDSKSACQQYTYSRSDDASSETIVNTENELTPCASTMAEFTDNIEDELSNAEEIGVVSDYKELTTGTMKRAHSVDSYMKIIQECTNNASVKKSRSDSFSADLKIPSDAEVERKSPMHFKTSFLIKEDSKESEESKDIPEKDVPDQENFNEISHKEENSLEIKSNSKSFQKKHVRQNSYTLDHPSSVLILAHSDCTCSHFDPNCISPHCSALINENEVKFNSAFTKEKVEVNIPKSHDQLKNLSLLNSTVSPNVVVTQSSEDMVTTVDIFPIVNEENSEKSNSGNAKESELEYLPESISHGDKDPEQKQKKKQLKEMFAKYFDVSDRDKKQKYYREIYKTLQESHEKKAKNLFEQQNQEWFYLQEEIKQDILLCESLKPKDLPSGSSPSIKENDQIKNIDCCNNEETEKELAISNSTISSLNQIPNSLQQNLELPCSGESLHSQCSHSKNLILPENSRASTSPSRELNSISPSTAIGIVDNTHLFKESDNSHASSNKIDSYSDVSKTIPNMTEPSRVTSLLLPHYDSASCPPNVKIIPSSEKCDNSYFCDSSAEQDKGCTSVNGGCDCDINFSHSEYMPDFEINCVSSYNDLSNTVHLTHQSHNLSLSISNKNLEPEFLVNCQDANCIPEKISSTSTFNNSELAHVSDKNLEPGSVVNGQNTNCIPEKISSTSTFKDSELPNVMKSTLDNSEVQHAMNDKVKRNIAPQTAKVETKFPVNNLFSLCAKTVKSGSFSIEDDSANERLINDPVLLKKFEKLPAFIKGYLTRRLFNSEHVQGLIKTLQDTAILITELRKKLSMPEYPVTEQDVNFHRQLIVQLMRTFNNLYDIFCNSSIKEKMNIIAESRKLRHKSETALQNSELDTSVVAKSLPPAAYKPQKSESLAAVKMLERKKKSTINTRTYTKEDFKNARSRSVLEMRTYTIDDIPNISGSLSCKSVSPSSGFKTSSGMKRKTASAKSRQCLHQHKWVP